MRESIIVSVDFGEPQYEDDASVFVDSTQVGIGLEWERPVSARSDWINAYGSLAAGWRRERLIGEGPLAVQQAASSVSAVAILSAGLRSPRRCPILSLCSLPLPFEYPLFFGGALN